MLVLTADKYSVQFFQLNESIKSSAKDFEFNQSMPITNFVGADKFKIVSQDRTNCRKWRQEPDMLSTDVYNECKIVEPKPNKYHQVCRVWTILPSADYSMEQYSKKLHAVLSTVHSCVVHSQQLTSGSNKTNDLRPFVDNEEYGLYNVSNRKNSHFFKLQPKSRSQIGSSRRKSCVFSKVFGFYKKRKLKVKKNRSDSRKERHISRLRHWNCTVESSTSSCDQLRAELLMLDSDSDKLSQQFLAKSQQNQSVPLTLSSGNGICEIQIIYTNNSREDKGITHQLLKLLMGKE